MYMYGQDGSSKESSSLIDNSQYRIQGDYIEENGKFRSQLPALPIDYFLGPVQDVRTTVRNERDIIRMVGTFSRGLKDVYRDGDWTTLKTTLLEDAADLLSWYLEPFADAPSNFVLRIGMISSVEQQWFVPLRLIAGDVHALYTLQIVRHDGQWRIEDILGSTSFMPFTYDVTHQEDDLRSADQ